MIRDGLHWRLMKATEVTRILSACLFQNRSSRGRLLNKNLSRRFVFDVALMFGWFTCFKIGRSCQFSFTLFIVFHPYWSHFFCHLHFSLQDRMFCKLFNLYRAFRRARIVRRRLGVVCCSLMNICRHVSICGDICSIPKLYKRDFGGTRAQIGVMFCYLEQSWHVQCQTLNLEPKISNPKL